VRVCAGECAAAEAAARTVDVANIAELEQAISRPRGEKARVMRERYARDFLVVLVFEYERRVDRTVRVQRHAEAAHVHIAAARDEDCCTLIHAVLLLIAL